MKTEKVFNINISFISYEEIFDVIENSIKTNNKTTVTYANAHSVRLCQSNQALLGALNSSDIMFNDGIGIFIAQKIISKGKSGKKSFNWTDNAHSFLKSCEEKQWKIFFVGGSDKIIQTAVKNLKLLFPNLKICGYLNGYNEADSPESIKIINAEAPDILWVGMGTPKQELWISKNKEKINCKVVQSVGDLFSLFAGKKVRGPKIFQRIGLEWFFRTIANPIKYFDRYIIGIPIFFFLILKEKMSYNNKP